MLVRAGKAGMSLRGAVAVADDTSVDPGRVDAHRDLVERARASDGCVHLAITANSVDPRRVNNVEVWTDSDALEAWRARANAPHIGIAIEDRAMARYDAVDRGPLFPALRI